MSDQVKKRVSRQINEYVSNVLCRFTTRLIDIFPIFQYISAFHTDSFPEKSNLLLSFYPQKTTRNPPCRSSKPIVFVFDLRNRKRSPMYFESKKSWQFHFYSKSNPVFSLLFR